MGKIILEIPLAVSLFVDGLLYTKKKKKKNPSLDGIFVNGISLSGCLIWKIILIIVRFMKSKSETCIK